MARNALIAALALFLAVCSAHVAYSDHNVFLPYAGTTPLMVQINNVQEYAWCADSRASNYPNFISQLTDVADQYTQRVGIKHRQVAFNDPVCMVKHTMPDGLTCDGWAGRIYYANNPVIVEYCYRLGYADWRTTQGHELGHGTLGLHEMYKDSGGSIGCTRRTDTVMDCGGGVRYPQPLDVSRGCTFYGPWCGQAPPPCNPCWDGEWWNFSDGWAVNPTTGEWRTPYGWIEWVDCNPDGCYNPAVGRFVFRGSHLYSPNFDLHSSPP